MSAIPDETINRVRSDANIVDVIGDYVRLRKTGKNWLGLCPFHDDRKPSFHVEPVKGFYKCFACGEGGDVFTFLKKINGWTFLESVRHLANQLGIEIPDEPVRTRESTERERLVTAVREAARRYHVLLREEAGETGLAYFRSRGFSDETITKFGLGYALDEWDWLLNELTAGGFVVEELERAGLLIKRQSGTGYYDRFRGRAMFPIFEATGRLVGFGARRMGEDPDQPKYINSPESPIYNKSRVLYGLFQAKDSIRKEGYALFVEGYADVISLHQHGVSTAVATCGTAIAREHAQLINRFSSRAVLIFDSDLAGEKATERGIDVLLAEGIDISIVRLPDGEDPDTFVQKFGAEELRRRISEAPTFIQFLARLRKNRGEFDAPDRQAEAIRAIVRTISLIPDRLKQELHINKLATDYHISEGLLMKELERATGEARRPRRWIRNDGNEQSQSPSGPPESSNAQRTGEEPPPIDTETPEAQHSESTELAPIATSITVVPESIPPAELYLARIMSLGDPQLLNEIFSRIDPEDFTHPHVREFINLVLAHYQNHSEFTLEEISLEEMSPELRNLVTTIFIEKDTVSDIWRDIDPSFKEPSPWRIAHHCLIRMQQEKIDSMYDVLQSQLLQEDLAEETFITVVKQLEELARRKQDLNTLISGD